MTGGTTTGGTTMARGSSATCGTTTATDSKTTTTGGTSTGSTTTGSTMTATDGTKKGGTTEVVWRPSAEDSNAAMVAVVAKATAEGGGVRGWWGGRGDCSDSRRGVQRSSSNVFDNHLSTSKSWSNTSPNNDGGGGGGRDSGGGRPLLSVGGTVLLICAHP